MTAKKPSRPVPGTAKSAAKDEVNNRLFFRLFQAANTLHKEGTRALDAHGVTTQQWSVLGALSRPQVAQGMTVGALGSFLMVSRQNLDGILNRLEHSGAIERVQSEEDRRLRMVRLTAKGAQLWRALTPLIYEFYDRALAGFSFDDRIHFLHYITRLRDGMREP
ncbi:MAG: MarR family transcriptional regulator [Rhodospirillales bacterium]|nr:MarR family transcriptional regulator [Rhodospirillales bacterium]